MSFVRSPSQAHSLPLPTRINCFSGAPSWKICSIANAWPILICLIRAEKFRRSSCISPSSVLADACFTADSTCEAVAGGTVVADASSITVVADASAAAVVEAGPGKGGAGGSGSSRSTLGASCSNREREIWRSGAVGSFRSSPAST